MEQDPTLTNLEQAPVHTETTIDPEAIREEMQRVRNRIDLCDARIVDIFAIRIEYAKEMGKLKKLLGLEVLNEAREEEVIKNVTGYATKNGIPARSVEDIYGILMGVSRNVQKQPEPPQPEIIVTDD